jgi:hypothetical protein
MMHPVILERVVLRQAVQVRILHVQQVISLEKKKKKKQTKSAKKIVMSECRRAQPPPKSKKSSTRQLIFFSFFNHPIHTFNPIQRRLGSIGKKNQQKNQKNHK